MSPLHSCCPFVTSCGSSEHAVHLLHIHVIKHNFFSQAGWQAGGRKHKQAGGQVGRSRSTSEPALCWRAMHSCSPAAKHNTHQTGCQCSHRPSGSLRCMGARQFDFLHGLQAHVDSSKSEYKTLQPCHSLQVLRKCWMLGSINCTTGWYTAVLQICYARLFFVC